MIRLRWCPTGPASLGPVPMRRQRLALAARLCTGERRGRWSMALTCGVLPMSGVVLAARRLDNRRSHIPRRGLPVHLPRRASRHACRAVGTGHRRGWREALRLVAREAVLRQRAWFVRTIRLRRVVRGWVASAPCRRRRCGYVSRVPGGRQECGSRSRRRRATPRSWGWRAQCRLCAGGVRARARCTLEVALQSRARDEGVLVRVVTFRR